MLSLAFFELPYRLKLLLPGLNQKPLPLLLGDILSALFLFPPCCYLRGPRGPCSPLMADDALPKGELIGIVIGAVVLFSLISTVPM